MVRPRRSLQTDNKAKAAAVDDESGADEPAAIALKKSKEAVVKRKRNSEIQQATAATAEESQEEGSEAPVSVSADANEPRKRRLASLNAEFLVHYCSTAASHAQPAAAEAPATAGVACEENQESKRRRTVSQDSAGRSKKPAEEVKPAQKAPGKRKQAEPTTTPGKSSKNADAADTTSKGHQDEDEATVSSKKGKPAARPSGDELLLPDNGGGDEAATTGGNNEQSSEEKLSRKPAARGRASKAKVATQEETPPPPPVSGRPKREASMRASAMLIQTNEIEKTRFPYYSSATTTPSSRFTATTPTSPPSCAARWPWVWRWSATCWSP